ncbi:aminotransferase class III-fold pyridoxal phosphate-dependent enzyme [Xenorhabdus khoisanae]|uniref:aminotransferase class III-fold pyridoxal phosphate-dependent enzyme n=1 Tax=Xenorhabdus khoisanae TaxID=880157 RepID=UPI0032B85AFC
MFDINSTISKQYSEYANTGPLEITKGEGAYLFSSKGEKYLDCGMALGSVLLGYSNKKINKEVVIALEKGVNFSRPSVYEREFYNKMGDLLNKEVSGKISKSSSMLLATIPRVCRALTGRKYILTQSEGAFLGNVDWFHSTSKNSLGVIEENTITFKHGCISDLRKTFEKYKNKIACVIIEPYRVKKFSQEYYKELRFLCDLNNCFLVYDETLAAFRFYSNIFEDIGGISADFTIIGKSIANGFPLACVIGKRDLFKSIDFKKGLFGFSNTHAGESTSLAASIATMEIIKNELDYTEYYNKNNLLKRKMLGLFHKYRIQLSVIGNDGYFWITGDEKLRVKMIKYMNNNNILFRGTFGLSFSHTMADYNSILEHVYEFCVGEQL